MKNLLLLLVVCFTGCASKDIIMTDATKRAPTTNVEIIYTDEKLVRPHKEIARLLFLAPIEEEFKAIRAMQNDAKKIGADAIILDAHTRGASKSLAIAGANGGFATSDTKYSWKSIAVIYTDK